MLVLATEATVQSHAYARACEMLGLQATEKACPLLVPLVEEGWIGCEHAAEASVTAEVLSIYLGEALHAAPASKTLLLGCTHYPLLRPAIEDTLRLLGHPLHIIDSARATARSVIEIVQGERITGEAEKMKKGKEPACQFFATDSVAKFERLGSQFLGRAVRGVRLVDLGG